MSVLAFTTAVSGLFNATTIPAIWMTGTVSQASNENEQSFTESSMAFVVSPSLATPQPQAVISVISSASYSSATQDIQRVSRTTIVPVVGPSISTPHPLIIIPLVPSATSPPATSDTQLTPTPAIVPVVSPSALTPHPPVIASLASIVPHPSSAQDLQSIPTAPVTSIVNPSTVAPHPLAIIPMMPSDPHPAIQDTPPAPTTQLLTVTETSTVTIKVPSSESETSPLPLPTPNPYRPVMEEWKSQACMEDLETFGITKFSGGRRNLKIVSARGVEPQRPSNDDCASVLRVFYPAGSINPAQRPIGGVQFYAAPLDFKNATSATLEYSVYFPEGFDFVLGGKLPGIYGGRTGCSGGDPAVECFSTRLMWRRHGRGELYMYAPKEKQTGDLCSDPRSVCDTNYGFSIGRGSFTWATGAWTNVRQIVTLNTPGKQDGSFVLEVNGKVVIERKDIYYRHDSRHRVQHGTGGGKKGSGLGGILGPILSDLVPRAQSTAREAVQPTSTITEDCGGADKVNIVQGPMTGAQQEWEMYADAIEGKAAPLKNAAVTTAMPLLQQQLKVQGVEAKPVGFEGLFFSTFFGGHDYRYATPRDQYVWFKDFGMSKIV